MDREELAEALAGIVAQSWEDPTGYIKPICGKCKHLIPESARCKAFPNGIPRAILANRADHTKPYPGDNGIRFEKKGLEDLTPEEREMLDALWRKWEQSQEERYRKLLKKN